MCDSDGCHMFLHAFRPVTAAIAKPCMQQHCTALEVGKKFISVQVKRMVDFLHLRKPTASVNGTPTMPELQAELA